VEKDQLKIRGVVRLMSNDHNDSKTGHVYFILNKEKKTIKLFEEQMIEGKIFTESTFENIDKLNESFSDFFDKLDFKKPVTVIPDTKSSEDAKATPDKPAKKSKVPSNKIDEELSDEFR